MNVASSINGDSRETIQLLQHELAETNREVLLLTVELEKRVEARTGELRAAQEELRQRNAQLQKHAAQLEAMNKELEMFSYSVSHDLRAPVRRINSFLSLLVDDHSAQLNPGMREYVDKACDCAQDMTRLIDSLLAFSRTGRVPLRESTVDFNNTIKRVIADMADDLAGRNIEWHLQPLPPVHGDPELLKLVWVNLISNAVKYSRPRNPAKIEIGFVSNNGQLEFHVRDNGVGFDMEYYDKLFGVFQRLHTEREFEGTGIGLANVQQIVHRHGGQVRADGRVGQGAVFYFTLPAPRS